MTFSLCMQGVTEALIECGFYLLINLFDSLIGEITDLKKSNRAAFNDNSSSISVSFVLGAWGGRGPCTHAAMRVSDYDNT